MDGWIKLHRQAMDSQYFSMGLKHIGMFKVLLLRANWKSGWFQGVKIEPGSLGTSISGLAESLCEDRRVVRKLLDDLENFGMIKRNCIANRWTHITICNWSTYQLDDQPKMPTDVQQCDQPHDQPSPIIEEGKKVRKEEPHTHKSACENFEDQFDGATNEILALWESCCSKANPPKTFLRDGKTIIGAGRLAESGATGEQIQKAMENLLADMDRRDTYTLEGLAANLGNWIDRKGWNSGNETRRPGASTRGQGHRPEDYSTDFD